MRQIVPVGYVYHTQIRVSYDFKIFRNQIEDSQGALKSLKYISKGRYEITCDLQSKNKRSTRDSISS